jgi:hypothetical protein
MKSDHVDILRAARHCLKCLPELQRHGSLVRRLIGELRPSDEHILSLFKAGCKWPAGHLFYRALHAANQKILHSAGPDWFVLAVLRSRHRGHPRMVITPAFGSRPAIDKFRARKSDAVLWLAIRREFYALAVNEEQKLLIKHVLGGWNYAYFLDAVESSISLTVYSPLEIAACNLVIDAAMPDEIKLASVAASPTGARGRRGRYRWLPRFTYYVREFYQAFSAKTGGHVALLAGLKNELAALVSNPAPCPPVVSTRQPMHRSVHDSLGSYAEQVLLRALYEDLQSTDIVGVSARANYHRLLWNGMRHLLLAHFGIYPEKIHKWMWHSAGKLRRVYPVSDLVLNDLKKRQIPFRPRPFDLEPPDLLAARYQLNLTPADFQKLSIEQQALYVIRCVLIYSGRRATCLTGVCLKHFKLSGLYADLIIPFSKGENTAMFPAPISGIWPEGAVAALKWFLANCKNHGKDQDAKLTVIAGAGDFIKGQDAGLRQALKLQFSRTGIPHARLHDGRITWLTWLPIRVWCARHRSLLAHPLLKNVVRGELFSNQALDQLAQIFPAGVDVMFGMQRLVSHATPQMAATVYIRSLPLLIRLRHDTFFGSA